jgi:hypothetical protein
MNETRGLRFTIRLVITLTVTMMSSCTQQRPPSATPIEPIGAIVDAFRSHNIVAFDEGDHGNEQGHAFRLSLIRDSRFAAVVDDIVVEFGNALYQDVMDRFVRGDAVADAELRKVWQNTTQPHFAVDLPIYEEFFRAVRETNLALTGERRLRVLLGDPPIDWDVVEKGEDASKWLNVRDSHAAEVIRGEVLARQRRALVIYGGWHLQRRDINTNYERTQWETLVGFLAKTGDAKLFTIWTNTMAELEMLDPQVTSWPRPSFALLRGTTLGTTDFAFYYPQDGDRFVISDGRPVPILRAEWRTLSMEDQFDAVLYLGPRSAITYARLSPSLCADADYMEMRTRRMSTIPGAQSEIERLKQYCADQRGR